MRTLTRPAALRAVPWAAGLLLSLGLGCAHGAPPASAAPAAAPAPADTWVPTAEEDAIYRLLSQRDGTVDCAAVEALAKDPLTALINTVEHTAQPPWVAVRAAHCLTSRHAAEVEPTLLAWVADPGKRGLAILIVDELDAMPEPLALRLASAALAGPHVADAQKRLPKSVHASVRALVPTEPATKGP